MLYKKHRFYAVFFTYAKHSQRRAMFPEQPITPPLFGIDQLTDTGPLVR